MTEEITALRISVTGAIGWQQNIMRAVILIPHRCGHIPCPVNRRKTFLPILKRLSRFI